MSTAVTRTSAQQNKVIAHEFYARISEGDIDGALALMSRDATWWLPGDPSTMPVAGLYTKDEITQLIRRMTLNVRGAPDLDRDRHGGRGRQGGPRGGDDR
jgi:ketosteroid isomerase-like protein